MGAEETALALKRAKGRCAYNVKHGIGGYHAWGKMKAGEEWKPDYAGFCAEIAVGRYFGCTGLGEDSPVGDGGVDLVTPEGAKLQVKYGSKRGYNFMVPWPEVERFKADYGVLVWPVGSEPEFVQLVGWLTRQEWVTYSEVVDKGYGASRLYRWERLRAMGELMWTVRVLRRLSSSGRVCRGAGGWVPRG